MKLPGDTLAMEKMPGHWVLARLGKRVLRPGGRMLTRQMLGALAIGSEDRVVEFAPGLGSTARLTLRRQPAAYTAVEREQAAAERLRARFQGSPFQCQTGTAEATGLPECSATVVYGEAMLTMQTPETKRRIVREAARLLQPGGRYGMHELCLMPDDLPAALKQAIQNDLTQAIHVGARPLTPAEWRALLEDEGFAVQAERTAPMHLLEPARLLADEGLSGAMRFAWNAMREPKARKRVIEMRGVFRKYAPHLGAVMMVGARTERP
ncbi:MAG: methyltransferase domain-containing protein [Chthonomonadales bacterium]|nr:methyltransferase domain-containing protein [Chthonomonadales bacterium]